MNRNVLGEFFCCYLVPTDSTKALASPDSPPDFMALWFSHSGSFIAIYWRHKNTLIVNVVMGLWNNTFFYR